MTETATKAAIKRIVVIANEECVGDRLFDLVRERCGDGPECEVILVAPALTSRIRYWLSDENGAMAEAQVRAAQSAERFGAAGIPVRAHIGDPDPLQALDDAVRTYHPNEVIVATHPPDHANWLEQGFAAQAQARFDLPIAHIVVDRDSGQATLVEHEEARRAAPAREHHRARDLAILTVSVVLAFAGSLLWLALYKSDEPSWVLWTAVLALDLGLKVWLGIVVWMLFLRRARADRLDL